MTPDSSIWVIRQSKGSIQWRYNTWLSNQPGIYVHLPCFIVKSASRVPKFYQIFQVVVPTSTTALSGSCRLCFSADPFWMSDLNCFLSCVYHSRSGWKTSFRRIIFFFHKSKSEKPSIVKTRFRKTVFVCWGFHTWKHILLIFFFFFILLNVF